MPVKVIFGPYPLTLPLFSFSYWHGMSSFAPLHTPRRDILPYHRLKAFESSKISKTMNQNKSFLLLICLFQAFYHSNRNQTYSLSNLIAI
jgi:hypothetical protein